MKLTRIIALTITAPIWLFAGAMIALVCLPLYLACAIGGIIEYGFTGKAEWLKDIFGK